MEDESPDSEPFCEHWREFGGGCKEVCKCGHLCEDHPVQYYDTGECIGKGEHVIFGLHRKCKCKKYERI